MSLILALGSNLNDRHSNLEFARQNLETILKPIAYSHIYESKAVDYTEQPPFLNQVLEYELPDMKPIDLINETLKIELACGPRKSIYKGPRDLDIDIIFWGLKEYQGAKIQIPHPHWDKRSFVVRPLQELPFYTELKKHFKFPTEFENSAKIIAL